MSSADAGIGRDGRGRLPPPPEHTRQGHEPNYVNVRAIVLVAVGMVVTAVVIHVALYFLQRHYNATAQESAVVWNPLGARQNEQPLNTRLDELPPPRLEGLAEFPASPPHYRSSLAVEGSPAFHPEDLRPERQAGLQTYGWVNKEKGIARIPVNRAMKAALEMNLLPAQQGVNRKEEPKTGRGAEGGSR